MKTCQIYTAYKSNYRQVCRRSACRRQGTYSVNDNNNMYTYEEYINKVINKELPVCQAAFLSVKRHLDDIEKSNAKGDNDYPFYFDGNEAKRPITFIQSLVHTKGE